MASDLLDQAEVSATVRMLEAQGEEMRRHLEDSTCGRDEIRANFEAHEAAILGLADRNKQIVTEIVTAGEEVEQITRAC